MQMQNNLKVSELLMFLCQIQMAAHKKCILFCTNHGKALWAISCPIQSVRDGIEIVRLVTFTEIISNGRIKGCRFGKSANDTNTIMLLWDTPWYCSVL